MSVRGNLETMELEGLLQWLAQGKKSGTLVVKNARDEKRLVFESGILISTFSTNPHEHVCRFLLDRDLVDRDRLREALKSNRGNSLQLGRALVEAGDLSGQTLQEVLEFRTEETVRDLLEWPEGNFQFLDGERPKVLPVTIAVSITPLLLRVADRIDRLHQAEATAAVASAGGAKQVISRGPLALVPGADPATDELPVIAFTPSAEEPQSEDEADAQAENHVENQNEALAATPTDSKKFLLFAGVAAFALAAVMLFFLINRSSSSPSTAGTPELAAAATPQPVVLELEAQIAALQSQLGTLMEEKTNSDGGSGVGAYQTEILRLQSELVAARSAVGVAQATSAAVDPSAVVATDWVEEGGLASSTASVPKTDVAVLEELEAGGEGLAPGLAEGEEMASLETGFSTAPDVLGAGGEGSSVGASSAKSGALSSAVQPESPEASIADPATSIEPVADRIVVPGPGVKAPTIIRSQKARYPPLARRMKREASVQVEVLVGLDGRPEEVRIAGPEVGLGFDSAALTAARGSRWEPATADGQPARMWATLRVDFRTDS